MTVHYSKVSPACFTVQGVPHSIWENADLKLGFSLTEKKKD